MGTIIRFPRHARASSSLRAARSAKTSSVMPETARSDAKATTAAQWPAGMPRVRQLLTVESDFPKAPATAPVPPKATMIASELSMPDSIVRKTRTCQGFATCETTFRRFHGVISAMDSDKDIGRRIVALREHHQKSQIVFAESISTANNTLSEYESGKKHLPIEKAKRICARWGASLDWLINGSVGQPGYELAVKLGPRPKIKEDGKVTAKSPSKKGRSRSAKI
jgi:transcriptional regulator with XRE-family HTH domain